MKQASQILTNNGMINGEFTCLPAGRPTCGRPASRQAGRQAASVTAKK